MIKSFSSQVVFCFAILIAISAYVGENQLSQYRGKGLTITTIFTPDKLVFL